MKGFIARDDSGYLSFYTNKPRRSNNCKFFMKDGGDTLELPEEIFPDITWEDEPKAVELTIELLYSEIH